MKYFIDTEFLEGSQKEHFPISLFRKNTPPTIDLISIGIVAESGREYYAISKDFNLEEAWNRYDLKECYGIGNCQNKNVYGNCNREEKCDDVKEYWIRENVLKPIWRELFFQADSCSGLSNKQTEQFFQDVNAGGYDHYFSFKSLKALISKYGKTNKDIAEEVKEFCTVNETRGRGIIDRISPSIPDINRKIEFYAYYADYDWVVFCWLFGKMMDLPKGFPKYCKDLKQILDEAEKKVRELALLKIRGKRPSFGWFSLGLKYHPNYPKQENEHSAIYDARWNKKLFDFLNSL